MFHSPDWSIFHTELSPFLNLNILQHHRGPVSGVSHSLCFHLSFSNQVLKDICVLFCHSVTLKLNKGLQTMSHFEHKVSFGL